MSDLSKYRVQFARMFHAKAFDGVWLTKSDQEAAQREAYRQADFLLASPVLAQMKREWQAEALREEWTVRHSQGIHPGSFTEQTARAWIAADIKADERRQRQARGRQRLLRRYVSEWEEVPLDRTEASGQEGGQ